MELFSSILKNMKLPVIVCGNSEGYPVVYANASAYILLNPRLGVAARSREPVAPLRLEQLLRFRTPGVLEELLGSVAVSGAVDGYVATLDNFERRAVRVSVYANSVETSGGEFIVVYLYGDDKQGAWIGIDGGVMNRVLQAAYYSSGMDEAINRILLIAGDYVHVSRAYIFEDTAPEITCKTYEWCNKGVRPAIQTLQNLRKEDYQYNEIVKAGVFVCDDIRTLPEQDFKTLDAQEIKSLAIIPMYRFGEPIGYVGFDDCAEYREWSANEIELLQSVAGVIASLIVRRNDEKKATRSLEVLQTISDNMDTVIFVNLIDTLELVFINKALADSLGKTAEELIGKPCWKVLQSGREKQCEWCPVKEMVDAGGTVKKSSYSWEFQNPVTKKWYLAEDSVIRWMDSRPAHIQTATEITHQKQYEKQLEQHACTDSLTGIYNREWGARHMERLFATPLYGRVPLSLCFIDLDGLKAANDTFGHKAGDEMIISTVNVIRSATRKCDMMFRWGGDEFILLLQCDPATAGRVMRGVQEKLRAVNETGGMPYKLGFSFGIADFNDSRAKSVDDIVGEADRKMYLNKTEKRKKLAP